MISRKLEVLINDNLHYFPVVTITGPRQSGKTTLIRSMFSHLPYYSLENPDTRALAISDPMAFLSQHNDGMILDEVQNVPELLSYLQGIVDEHRDRRYILSGSSQFKLQNSITQSLAGRTAVLELFPLSINEIADLADTDNIDRLILQGFYPAIYAGNNIPRLFYPAYMRTYLERDVRQLLQVKDLYQFQTFLRLCAGRIGSPFNASELSNEVGISVNTVRSWLSILQASYIVFMLHPYFDNSRKRLTKIPKLYFYDTGLVCYLLGIENEKQLNSDRMRGHLFENMVISDMVKHRAHAGQSTNMMFYRDSNGNEIDLIVPDGQSWKGYEIKSSATYNSSFEKGFHRLTDQLDARLTHRAVIYCGTQERRDAHIEVFNYASLLSV
ncbi:MAG: ATPase AAA [bacterium P3]|nr:MAG: ATPase AAA [bacterium P3]KWW28491.1 MAG: ATPase AAA [bacterium F083]